MALIDTGIWRNVGARLYAVREYLRGDPMFCANCSDGLTDVRLPEMIEFFKASGKIGCFLAVQPNFSYHLVDFDERGLVTGLSTAPRSGWCGWGGGCTVRPGVVECMHDGVEVWCDCCSCEAEPYWVEAFVPHDDNGQTKKRSPPR